MEKETSNKPTKKPATLNEQLHAGIEAAQAGQPNVARGHLKAVLVQEPQNIPALLWLAFIAPTPEESIELLEQVLSLDPTNEPAKSGLQWAKTRLETQTPSTTQEDEASDQEDEPLNLRQQLFSSDSQKKGRKSVLAHRARRTINPFLLLLVIIVGVAAYTSSEFTRLGIVSANTTQPAEDDIFGITAQLYQPNESPIDDSPTDQTAISTDPISVNDNSIKGQTAQTTASRVIPIAAPAQAVPSSVEPAISKFSREGDRLTLPDPPPTIEIPLSIAPVLIGPTTTRSEPVLFEPVEVSQLAHQPSYPEQKWIEVDVTTQRVTAWEGNIPVMSFATSTGLPETPTILGKFNIYWKLESATMTGDNYYLPDVPYTMYFHEDFGIHGTYWHNNFGQPMSHGCVNLPSEDAEWFFRWAEVGTPVSVRY